MDLEALVTDELREELASYTLEWFDVEASSRRPPHATVGVRTPEGAEVTGLLHRRRPGRRDLPRRQRRDRARRAAARVPRRRGHRRRGRARRGLGRGRAPGPVGLRPGRRHRHPRGGGHGLRARGLQRACARRAAQRQAGELLPTAPVTAPERAGRRRRRRSSASQRHRRRARGARAPGELARGARPARRRSPRTTSRRCARTPSHPGEEARARRAAGA